MTKKPSRPVPPDPVLELFFDGDNDYQIRLYASEADRADRKSIFADWTSQAHHVVDILRTEHRQQFLLLGGKDRIGTFARGLMPEHDQDNPLVLTTTINPVATHIAVPETAPTGEVVYSDFQF